MRRKLAAGILLTAVFVLFVPRQAAAEINLALSATPSTSYVSGHETLDAINNGSEPRSVDDHSHGAYGNWPKTGTQWVQYEWSKPVSTAKVDVYWWADGQGIRVPTACRLLYWDGSEFVPVKEAAGLAINRGKFSTTTFAEVTTTRLRLEFDSSGKFSTGILQWKVYDTGKSPRFAPRVSAGVDRVVVLPAAGGAYYMPARPGPTVTYLRGNVRGAVSKSTWLKESGPGDVTFADVHALATNATFSKPGDYVLKLEAFIGDLSASGTIDVRVEAMPAAPHLESVPTRSYKINSPLWNDRAKQLIVHWIPHVVDRLSEPNLREGGIENFIEAGNKLAGRPFKRHVGAPWANAFVLNSIEAICIAEQVDPQEDAELAGAQKALRQKLEEWIPIVLAAEEPDGYLQTRFTLAPNGANEHWSLRGDHEGYIAGYLIEAAIAHYWMTDGHDRRLYDGARRLADCWDAHIGPAPKKSWFDGHEEIEQALVRLGRLVNQVEGAGQGDRYIKLAKFLLDCRGGGGEYDQSHVPVTQQYEATGHAVRAAYMYTAMADIAMETGDPEYCSAVQSIWSNLVNKKYYVTGGIGSGETSEGFGRDFSLPNYGYCESCSGCGEVFFQHRLNMAYRDARYADLFEETLYNALLGDVDLAGNNFTYTNPLESSEPRYSWHECPCCVSNIPRTLLELPTWIYSKSADGIYVNLFIGSTVNVGKVADTDVEMVQTTDYPWSGKVTLKVNPSATRGFALLIRSPNRAVSELYTSTPSADGIESLSVNGTAVVPSLENGYVVIRRNWSAGDKVEFTLPMKVQIVKASDKIAADRGRIALRYGPLMYCFESADQKLGQSLKPNGELKTEFIPGLLNGVTVIRGQFSDGSPMMAIPYYARNNRGGRSTVWIKE